MKHILLVHNVKNPLRDIVHIILESLPPKAQSLFPVPIMQQPRWCRVSIALCGWGVFVALLCWIFWFKEDHDVFKICDLTVPHLEQFPEETQLLFAARRALTVPDESIILQHTLAQLRKDPSDAAQLLRFYLVYDPILSPEHVTRMVPSAALCDRIEMAFFRVKELPISAVTRAILMARLAVSRWVVQNTSDTQDVAYRYITVPTLKNTIDALDLRLFMLHRILQERDSTGKIWLNGAWRPTEAVRALYHKLAKIKLKSGTE